MRGSVAEDEHCMLYDHQWERKDKSVLKEVGICERRSRQSNKRRGWGRISMLFL